MMDQNPDLSLGLDVGVDLAALGPDDLDFSFFEPLADDNAALAGAGATPAPDASAVRPYHSKRPHKKSRAGCKNCKARKVKCNEARPSCRACTLRKEKCVYPDPVSTSSAPGSGSSARSVTGSTGEASPRPHADSGSFSPASPDSDLSGSVVVSEPMFIPSAMGDALDMKMLWFYTAETYMSFNVERGPGLVDHVLRVKIPELAFKSPFLMQTILGLSALQLKTLRQDIPPQKALSYRAKAFAGYRQAIEAARPEDFPALLAGSLFVCALSSEMFREADTKPLYIIDWMTVWRGIGLIVSIVSPAVLAESGLAVLFYRPPIDLDKSTRHIPNNLLWMVESIRLGDADYEHQQTYYETLRYLGSLYEELEKGFSPIMDLRVVTFFTFIPKAFVPLAQEHRPRALIILAHYCAFTKQNRGPWWMSKIGNKQIEQISELIGESWEHLMRVPRRVLYMDDRTEIARTILENYHWTAPELDLYELKTRDPRVWKLKLITDRGIETKIVDGEWQTQEPQVTVETLRANEHVSELQSKAMYNALEPGSVRSLDSPSPASTSDLSVPSPAARSVASSGSGQSRYSD